MKTASRGSPHLCLLPIQHGSLPLLGETSSCPPDSPPQQRPLSGSHHYGDSPEFMRQPLLEIFCPAARYCCLIFSWGNVVSLPPTCDKSQATLNCSRIIPCCWCYLHPHRLWAPTGRDQLLSLPPVLMALLWTSWGPWSVRMSRPASGREEAAAISLVFQRKLQPSSSGTRTNFKK